jgi:hypothetical protein
VVDVKFPERYSVVRLCLRFCDEENDVTVIPGKKVADLRLALATRVHLNPADIRFLCDGAHLGDEIPLRDFNGRMIEAFADDGFEFARRHVGPSPLSLSMPPQKTKVVFRWHSDTIEGKIAPNETIGSLRAKLAQDFRVDVRQVSLLIDGRCQSDNAAVGSRLLEMRIDAPGLEVVFRAPNGAIVKRGRYFPYTTVRALEAGLECDFPKMRCVQNGRRLDSGTQICKLASLVIDLAGVR